MWVLKVPSGFEEVPFPSFTYIHFPDSLLCSILCTKHEVFMVLVWLILEYFPLALIFVPGVATNFHLLEDWSSSYSLDNLPWLRYLFIVPRCLLSWLSIVTLKELSSEVVILGCSIPYVYLRELDVLASQ